MRRFWLMHYLPAYMYLKGGVSAEEAVRIDPTNAEAKGLMDIMANLERQQPGNTEPEPEPEPEPEEKIDN